MQENHSPWLLPAGIDEMLPDDARRLETLRRRLLDLFDRWGYELVIPPLIEFLESLLVGAGSDLDIQTFKLTDQLSGRLMGVRADMTPQVARLDAHRLQRSAPNRLCYLGTVLHTRPDGFAGSRSPYQVGAELYGHAGPESDAEVLCLMLATLQATGVRNVYVDLGHVGIYRTLAADAGLDARQEAQLFDLLQRKALPEMREFLGELNVATKPKEHLAALVNLNGDSSVLVDARKVLKGADASVLAAIDYIEKVAVLVSRRLPEVTLHYDLAELRGYHYQTGIVFAAFAPGQGQEIARGGRYDDIGKFFGRSRPATGFSTDLRSLIALVNENGASRKGIFAPAVDDPALYVFVEELREKGERVIFELPGQNGLPAELGCDRRLVRDGKYWRVELI
jgi:ATP phosphoribosyltransferase regulatory subunit